ncbi:conserved hypothetical protein [uncultured Gammaproteobacteria bacterium]
MEPTILVFTWFWLNHSPVSTQIEFSTMALCQDARQNMIRDRKRVVEDYVEKSKRRSDDSDSRRVPQLAAACVALVPRKVPADQASGADWLMSQPVNVLDWGLQKVASTADSIRSIKVIYDHDGIHSDESLGVDFTLNDTGQFKYVIQASVTTRSPELVSDRYCLAALSAWRQAVLRTNGDNPSASIIEWFSHADRNQPSPPKKIAEAIASNFDFKMTINGIGNQPSINCTTPFAAAP